MSTTSCSAISASLYVYESFEYQMCVDSSPDGMPQPLDFIKVYRLGYGTIMLKNLAKTGIKFGGFCNIMVPQ